MDGYRTVCIHRYFVEVHQEREGQKRIDVSGWEQMPLFLSRSVRKAMILSVGGWDTCRPEQIVAVSLSVSVKLPFPVGFLLFTVLYSRGGGGKQKLMESILLSLHFPFWTGSLLLNCALFKYIPHIYNKKNDFDSKKKNNNLSFVSQPNGLCLHGILSQRRSCSGIPIWRIRSNSRRSL